MSDNPIRKALEEQKKGRSPQPSQTTLPPQLETPPQERTSIEEEKPRKYPHRISFDMETKQYKQLKRAAFEGDRPMNEILREAVDKWLRDQVDV
ncbi:MAG: hypothetical protein IGR90_06250 [Synechococcales cyanobacterium K32_A2020_035]|nr:hypothetical protein [Synechococcales cyanobacterium K32_A2020_035]